jgi:SAM-dependent methyltransferase
MSIDTVADRATEQLSSCPLCGGASWKVLPLPGRWIGAEVFGDLQGRLGLVRCHSCQLVFANPRPTEGRLFTFYSGDTYSCHEATGSASAGAKADLLLERIATCLPPNTPRTLLDYGAGGGGFLSHARDRGWEVRGFEPGKRGREACQRAGLDVTDNLEELPSGEFGLITLHHVFEHLANPIEALDGIRRLLAEDGRLFIEVPNARSLRARLALPFLSRQFNIDERYRAYPIHLMYYSDRTLRGMLGKARWTVAGTFTLGMGMDEFILHSEPGSRQASCSNVARSVRPLPRRRLRHLLRDTFLRLGLGENLAALAYPG